MFLGAYGKGSSCPGLNAGIVRIRSKTFVWPRCGFHPVECDALFRLRLLGEGLVMGGGVGGVV